MNRAGLNAHPPGARTRALAAFLVLWHLAAGCGAPGAVSASIPELQSFVPREAAFDVEHYALEIDLDPTSRSIAGLASVRVYPRGSELSEIALDFVDLKVREVRDERGEVLEFEHANGVLTIRLRRPAKSGEFAEVRVRYDGVPRRGLYFCDLEDGVATQVFTQGECEDSRGWFPCFDFPSDRATSEIAVRMPAHWTSVAPGERVERRELADGRALERWRMTTPHPAYLTSLVAGEFTTEYGEWDGIPLIYLADAELAPHMKARFASTPRILEFFSRLTGVRYPYAKYSQACVANFTMGGMENISATTLTDQWLTDERGERDSPAASLIAHEAAHQWFGDLLTCRDWSHIWLNEGWATYGAELFVEATEGREAFEAAMGDVRDSYLAADVGHARRPMLFATYREPLDLFTTGHAYPGGAIRLHQLRFELGSEVFFAGMRRYLADHRGKAVTSEDFQASMEAASGRDLEPFFDQWFEEQGYPELDVRWEWDADQGVVRLDVEQVQQLGDGTLEVFRLPAEVELGFGGSQATPTHNVHVEIDERRESFTFPALERPRWVSFDPHGWLCARVRSERSMDEWVAIAQASSHPQPRREAVSALARIARESRDERGRALYVQVIEERLSADEIPAVRAAAARALGSLAPSFGSVALQAAGAEDPHASVRVAALNSLIGWAPDERLAEYAREQYDACFSWATMGAAAQLYARAAPADAYGKLQGQLGVESPHDVLAGKLISALSSLDDPRVLPELERLAFDTGISPRIRESAVRALGPLARSRPDTRRKIEALLHEDDFRLRGAAIEVLTAWNDPQSLPAIRAAYPSLVDPRQRRALEALMRVRAP